MTYRPANITPPDPIVISPLTKNSTGLGWSGMREGTPTSGAGSSGLRMYLYPFFTSKGYSLARWWWLNGATVGTDYVQAGIYDENLNLFKASPRTLSAGTINEVQYANPGIHGTHITDSGDTTDGTVFTTASVTLKAGVLYLISVVNTAASAGAISSIDSATGGYPTFTSRSTTQFNTAAHRVSIWSAVPTADFTGALRINYGATQTLCLWAVDAFYHVDTATTDGVVQNAVGTGSSVTPLATLAAFGSANNATFGAFGVSASAAPTMESASYLNLGTRSGATPTGQINTVYRPDNDTTVSETIASNPWGACAVEIKSLGTGAVALPPMRGYLAFNTTGTTATFFRVTTAERLRSFLLYQVPTTPLPASASPTTNTGNSPIWTFGFTSRSSP